MTNVVDLKCTHTVRLQHLTGEEWCREQFARVEDAWAWVAGTVADQLDARPEDVDCFEGPEGDMVTLDGIPVCWVVHGTPPN